MIEKIKKWKILEEIKITKAKTLIEPIKITEKTVLVTTRTKKIRVKSIKSIILIIILIIKNKIVMKINLIIQSIKLKGTIMNP